MDLGLSRDWFGSFVRYQRRMNQEFRSLQRHYGFEVINANRRVATVQEELKDRIRRVLQTLYPSHRIRG
jgi:thymidylate kinase